MKHSSQHYIRISVLLFVVAMTILGLLGNQGHNKAISLVKAQYNGQQMLVARQTAAGTEGHMELLARELELLAQTRAVQDMDLSRVKEAFARVFAYVRPLYVNDIGLLDARGILRFNLTAPQIIGKDFSFRSYYKNARKMADSHPSYEFITFKGFDAGRKGIVIALPIFQEGKVFVGVVLFTIKADELAKGLLSPESTASIAWIVDMNGNIIYHPFYSSGPIEETILNRKKSFSDFIKQISSGQAFQGEYIAPDGAEIIAAAFPAEVADQNWFVVLSAPSRKISELVKSFSIIYQHASMITLLCIAVFCSVVIHLISKWNKELEETVRVRTSELKKSEEKLRDLIETVNDWIWAVDDQGIYTYASPRVKDLLGYAPEEVLGKTPFEFMTTDEVARVGSFFRDKLSRMEPFERLENVNIHKDGRHVILETSGAPVLGQDGALLGYFGVDRDITDRKQAESELADEKELLAVTLGSIGDGVISTDANGDIVLLNAVAEQLTGWSSSAAVGRSFDRVFHIVNEQTREQKEDPVDLVLKTGEIVGLDNAVLIAQDGTERIVADSCAPIRGKDGNIIGVVLVFRDITVQRELEAELNRAEKIESVGLLAGGIAHDFNNSLSIMLGNVSLAKRAVSEDDKVFARLTLVEKAIRRAEKITQQLITFAKGGAPIKETVSISELITETADFVLRGSDVKCEYSIPADLWVAQVDTGQIGQVISNLILHADQDMQAGGIIEVQAENYHHVQGDMLVLSPGRFVKISIKDRGVGIPRQQLDKIFDPYFTAQQKGDGLGLATAYSIIKQHNGIITVDSELGAWTVFAIYLPASSEAIVKSEKTVGNMVGGSEYILIMDDDEMIRDSLSDELAELGYGVETSADGDELLRIYQQASESGRPFAAVVMDLTVPGGMGGKEAVSRLRKISPQAKVVISSGYSDDPVMANYRDYGFSGVVVKPYSLQEISMVLREVLDEQ